MNTCHTNISIDALQPEDIPFIKKLERECKLSFWSSQDYLQETNRSDSLSFTAKMNQKLIGFVIARLIMLESEYLTLSLIDDEMNKKSVIEFPEYDLCVIEIYNLCVSENQRRKDIGKSLVNRVINAVNCQRKKIWLELRKSNTAAKAFYTNLNFVELGVRKNFYNHPTEDAILMELSLLEEN